MQPALAFPAPPPVTPSQDHEDPGPQDPQPASRPIETAVAGAVAATGPHGNRSAVWRVRAGTAALWLLIALAAAGGIRSLLAGGPARPADAETLASTTASAAGFAQLFVATYLESGAGQARQLRRFYPGGIDLSGVTAEARYASHTAAVSMVPLGAGSWSITVAADVLVAGQGGYVRSGVQDYQVGVTATRNGMIATSLPSLVPAPPAPSLAALDTPPVAAPGRDAATRALAAFFGAYLTGGDTSTATPAPAGSGIRPITPAPFASAQLTGVAWLTQGGGAAPGRRVALAEISATDARGFKQVLEYTVRIGRHSNRWQVLQILPAGAPASPSATPGG